MAVVEFVGRFQNAKYWQNCDNSFQYTDHWQCARLILKRKIEQMSSLDHKDVCKKNATELRTGTRKHIKIFTCR